MITCISFSMNTPGFNFKNFSPAFAKCPGKNYAHEQSSSSIIPRSLNAFATSSEQKKVLSSDIPFKVDLFLSSFFMFTSYFFPTDYSKNDSIFLNT